MLPAIRRSSCHVRSALQYLLVLVHGVRSLVDERVLLMIIVHYSAVFGVSQHCISYLHAYVGSAFVRYLRIIPTCWLYAYRHACIMSCTVFALRVLHAVLAVLLPAMLSDGGRAIRYVSALCPLVVLPFCHRLANRRVARLANQYVPRRVSLAV